MRIYQINDAESQFEVGVLLYYEKEKEYIIELDGRLDEWTAPLLFSAFVKKRIYTIPRDISKLWVQERVIPSGRQNISSILKQHKMKEYDEMSFLELSKGQCSQDALYIKKTDELPDYAKKRQIHNLTDCTICEDYRLLCFFEDGLVKIVDLKKMKKHRTVEKIMGNVQLYKSGKIATGGYSVSFNNSWDIDAETLYKEGIELPIKASDFLQFARHNLIDTTESCEILECTRQNLSYLVKEGQLTPLKEVRGNLYLKGDVVKNQW